MSDKPPSHQEVMEAFDGFRWGARAIEPDKRVTVLYEARTRTFLYRVEDNWLWLQSFDEIPDPVQGTISWEDAVAAWALPNTDSLRIPTADELRAGGFPVPGEDEQVEEPEHFALQAIVEGTALLDEDEAGLREACLASAKFMASMAATSYELLSLLTEEIAYRRSRDETKDNPPVAVGETASSEKESAHRSRPPVGGSEFPFAG